MITTKKIILIAALLASQLACAGEKTLIRLGALAFGTVNWELTAMKQAGMMETEHYRVQVIKMANPQAGKIACQVLWDMTLQTWLFHGCAPR
ncbi:MAG: hypothetical protein H0A75_05120 [Candidatus Methanofishera endochildressiae]|uniref:ABC transporter substrate-binding protein n=1 Tax=Candidatus Methanofishera endochildressiae TaxID=2738884 RepID=A0A7Z0MNR4_9GAMM|nr:hypothetical protein [Candidatus Methanofishera endochildressiae]